MNKEQIIKENWLKLLKEKKMENKGKNTEGRFAKAKFLKEYKNLIKEGDIYNSWMLTGKYQGDTLSNVKVEVNCVCGKIKYVNLRNVIKGSSKGCGCRRSRINPDKELIIPEKKVIRQLDVLFLEEIPQCYKRESEGDYFQAVDRFGLNGMLESIIDTSEIDESFKDWCNYFIKRNTKNRDMIENIEFLTEMSFYFQDDQGFIKNMYHIVIENMGYKKL